MHNRALALFLAVGVMVVAFACGGDDGGDDGQTSGVDPGKALTEVTPDERMALCDYFGGLVDEDDLARFGCYSIALVIGELGGDCEMTAQDCLADPEFTQECDLDEELPACASQVTVGEMEACGREQAAIVSDVADTISCDSDPAELDQRPPACAAIDEECPELFEEEG